MSSETQLSRGGANEIVATGWIQMSLEKHETEFQGSETETFLYHGNHLSGGNTMELQAMFDPLTS